MDVFPDGEFGKHAVTHYKVLERFSYVTLVECKLETGRTHQIRAHFKYLGHPLFNDERYGGNRILKGTTYTKYKQFVDNCFKILPRQALHAKTLGFEHPVTKEKLFFNSELPDDMQHCLEKWRNYTVNQHEIDLIINLYQMKIVISPAKSLNFESEAPTHELTQPIFLKEAERLNQILKKKSARSLSKLMSISPALGQLNYERNQNWELPFTLDNAKQAIYAFTGEVYRGIDVNSFL